MVPNTTCLFQLLLIFLAFCAAVRAEKTIIPRRHRYHNRIFHPNQLQDNLERTRRDDDCQEDDWESMTFAGRVANGKSDGVLQGLVLRLINARDPRRPYRGSGMYTAEVRIDCLYRGWNFGAVVNISGFGETPNDCVESHVSEGKSYIFLVQTDWYGYAVYEFNDQTGAVEVTSRSENEVKSLYRCRGPTDTSSVDYSLDYSFSVDGDDYIRGDDAKGSPLFYSFVSNMQLLCPIYEFYSNLYENEYYDYNRDGLVDYCPINEGSIEKLTLSKIGLLCTISLFLTYSWLLS